ncbi:MAG: DUF3089 domain-containing protein [Clostridia bacterium]|nr:DUF3089 domain-containing protein [Clostridia bacterium]
MKTDYGDSFSWIETGGERAFPVDVFHLTPTSWIGVRGGECLSSVSDPAYRAQAEFNVHFQADVFKTVGNIFAPHYRQLEPFYTMRLSPEDRLREIGREPREDVFAALDHFFEIFNGGRPFILSAHSQGTIVSLFILSEYMRLHPDRYARMIAAYLPGYSVTEEYMKQNPHLKFAEGTDDTGVIISYNTEAPCPEGESGVLLPGALCINPITWVRGAEYAPRELSKGSMIKGRKIERYADAQIEEGTGRLVCSTAEPKRLHSTVFPEGVYHVHDYGLYYYDLRENARLRVNKYFEKNCLQK